MCLRMLSTSLSHCCWGTFSHSWCKNSSSPVLFDGLWPSIFLLIAFQRFSMGFRSGDWLAMTGFWSCGPTIHTLIDQAVWHGSLSCWKKQSSELGNIIRRKQDSCSLHKDECSWFQPCWSHPQIITDPPPNAEWHLNELAVIPVSGESFFAICLVSSFVVPVSAVWPCSHEPLSLKFWWNSLYPSASKARTEPFFSSLKMFSFQHFWMVIISYYLVPITFEILLVFGIQLVLLQEDSDDHSSVFYTFPH